MKEAEKILYIPIGIMLIFVFPIISLLWERNAIIERAFRETCREFEAVSYEQGEITLEDYLYAYEKCLILNEKREFKVRIIHLEGEKNGELSDFFYTYEDEEIRELLADGPVKIEKGSILEIYE